MSVARLVAVSSAIFLPIACSSLTRTAAPLPPLANSSSSRTLAVRIGSPNYIGAGTKSIRIRIAGPTKVRVSGALTVNAKGCKSKLVSIECTLTIPLSACPTKKRCYTASVATYDAEKHLLSAELKFGFYIGSSDAVIPLVLQGIPKSVAFIPAGDAVLSGSQAAGFVTPKCNGKEQAVTVAGVDADGNYILGVGAPKVTLVSGDPEQLGVSRTGPNSFGLTPPVAPNYPFGNHTVRLTATATPNKKRSGAAAVHGIVEVTYSGDICGTMTEFPVPTASSQPFGLAAGRDGAMWFTEYVGNKIARVTTTGRITEYPLSATRSPSGITTGPDGNVWFAESFGANIGRVTTTGAITEFPVASTTWHITTGPDGNLWFTECSISKIGRMTTSGSFADFPTMTPGSTPRGIVSGPGGALWFVECSANKLGTITTSGTVTEFPITSPASGPWDIAQGPGNTLMFTQYSSSQVGQANASGTITAENPLAGTSNPSEITLGPDAAFWFSESNTERIGRIAPNGTVTETPLAASTDPFGIATGPDGAIWFAERGANKIGRLY